VAECNRDRVQLGISTQFAQVILRSKRVVATLVNAVRQYGYANFSRYPGTTPPGISRNAYGLLGSASVLVELRGVGLKANGSIAKTGFVAGMSVEALADRSLYTTDIAPADALVLAPDTASLFGKCLAPEYTPENYNFCREKLGLSPVTTPPPQEAAPDDDRRRSSAASGWTGVRSNARYGATGRLLGSPVALLVSHAAGKTMEWALRR
jgi:hypothetical protein